MPRHMGKRKLEQDEYVSIYSVQLKTNQLSIVRLFLHCVRYHSIMSVMTCGLSLDKGSWYFGYKMLQQHDTWQQILHIVFIFGSICPL